MAKQSQKNPIQTQNLFAIRGAKLKQTQSKPIEIQFDKFPQFVTISVVTVHKFFYSFLEVMNYD
jgi:hypothetical protein